MKKNGFTLAEVLITLAIIGVVATLTLPSLMSNTQEQQAVTGFKKAMNTLNEVAQMNAAVDGFDYSGVSVYAAPSASNGIYNATTGVLEQSVWGMMRSKANVDIVRTTGTNKITSGGCNGKAQIFFRDGTALCYESTTTATAGASADFISAVIDTNGLKAPNQISKCGEASCTNAAKKLIKDQFRITLRGASAIPGQITVANGNITEGTDEESYAARWAMLK